MLAGDVTGNVVHRPGAIERDERDDVLDTVRLEAAERVPHACTFQLEDAHRSTAAQHIVGRLVVERDRGEVDLDPGLAQNFARIVEHGERLEAQQVELHEPGHLGVLHRELCRRHLRARIAIEGHQLAERPVADDDARSMGRGMAVQPFELERYLDQAGDCRIVVAFGREPGLGVERLLQRHRVGRIVGNQLAQTVDAAVAEAEHTAYIAEHRAGLKLTEGDDLGDTVLAIAPADIVDDLVAALRAEVDVEVGHRHSFGIEEALEQQAEAERVEIGDGQRPRHHRAGARTPARADRDPLSPRPAHDVGDDEEVARELHLDDDAELVGESLPIRRRRFLAGRAVHIVAVDLGFEAALQSVLGLGAQRFGFARVAGGSERRQYRLPHRRHDGATPGDHDGVVHCLR